MEEVHVLELLMNHLILWLNHLSRLVITFQLQRIQTLLKLYKVVDDQELYFVKTGNIIGLKVVVILI